MSKSIAVLGLGRFGRNLALHLADIGVEVLAVDQDPEIVKLVADSVTTAVVADLTNEEAVRELGLNHMDAAVVAIGSDLQSAIIAVMSARENGVPYILAKSSDERMTKILKKIGVDGVICPEEETSLRVAEILGNKNFLEFFRIDDRLCLVDMKPRPEWIGKTLRDLHMRQRYHANVISMRTGEKSAANADPDLPITGEMDLLIIVDRDDLEKLNG
jgi:trk system potassium uptake protein TrkA